MQGMGQKAPSRMLPCPRTVPGQALNKGEPPPVPAAGLRDRLLRAVPVRAAGSAGQTGDILPTNLSP